MTNPSAAAIRRLWQELSVASWYLWQAGQITKQHRDAMRNVLRRRRTHRGPFGAGNTLIIRDLAEFPADNWARHYAVAIHGAFGGGYVRLLDRLQAVEHGWGIVHGFEVFERYARHSASLVLARDPLALSACWRDLRRRVPNRRQAPRSLTGWLKRVEESNPSLPQVWAFLTRQLPPVQATSTRNNRGLHLADWLAAIGVARHAAVHTFMVVPRSRWRRLPSRQQHYLRAIGGRASTAGFGLAPSESAARESISILAECGYTIYRGLAAFDGTDPRVILTS